jgi:hypothetical protein
MSPVKGGVSTQSLKIELESRAGVELLPPSFPVELLISLTRAIALVVDNTHPPDEFEVVNVLLRGYVRRVIGIDEPARLADFDARVNELIPKFAFEIYECMFEELISRTIEHDVRIMSLQDRMYWVLDGETEVA